MIYTKNGGSITDVYDVDGVKLSEAYDIDCNRLMPFALKVMQYNVGQWYVGDHDNVPAAEDEAYFLLQNSIIETYDADILLLEEYTAQFSKAGRTALSMLTERYPYYHEQTDGTTTTVTQRAVFSKYPLSDYTTHALHAGYYFDTCYVTVNGKNIYLGCAHFHWNNPDYRAAEAESVLADISGKPYVIFGGDLNTADCFDTSGEGYLTVVKKFVDAGYTVGNGGEFGFIPTYGGGTSELTSCLDNIIVTPNITINSIIADQTKLTDSIVAKIDHVPLVATLTVG